MHAQVKVDLGHVRLAIEIDRMQQTAQAIEFYRLIVSSMRIEQLPQAQAGIALRIAAHEPLHADDLLRSQRAYRLECTGQRGIEIASMCTTFFIEPQGAIGLRYMVQTG